MSRRTPPKTRDKEKEHIPCVLNGQASVTTIDSTASGAEKGSSPRHNTSSGSNTSLQQAKVTEYVQWQQVPVNRQENKKRKIDQIISPVNTRNRYEVLGTESQQQVNKPTVEKTGKVDKPPPIFLYGIDNYEEMRKLIETVVDKNDYTYKVVRGKQTIIYVSNIELYKKVWKSIREAKLIHHTFPTKEDKSYRVILKGIHPTDVDEDELKEELKTKGHIVKTIAGMKSKKSGMPLPMYFVNLQQQENNKEIFNIRYLNNVRITFEPIKSQPGVPKLVQCHRCQKFGHTKNYCSQPPRCVKCGQGHLTAECIKTKDTPATCALCLENHPANYKGCRIRKEIQDRRHRNKETNNRQEEPQNREHAPQTTPPLANVTATRRSYSQVVTQAIDHKKQRPSGTNLEEKIDNLVKLMGT